MLFNIKVGIDLMERSKVILRCNDSNAEYVSRTFRSSKTQLNERQRVLSKNSLKENKHTFDPEYGIKIIDACNKELELFNPELHKPLKNNNFRTPQLTIIYVKLFKLNIRFPF